MSIDRICIGRWLVELASEVELGLRYLIYSSILLSVSEVLDYYGFQEGVLQHL